MKQLEDKAAEAWATLGVNAKEFVALGFMEPETEEIIWYELPNVAGVGEFLVEGEAIHAVMLKAIGEGVSEYRRLLWHSHYNTVEPSKADVDEFPEWLVDVGVVWHVPTQTTTLYNSGGIFQVTDSSTSTLSTQER